MWIARTSHVLELKGFSGALVILVSLLPGLQLRAGFTLPPGFVVGKVAGEPEVRFPMFAAFDDKGRLFVTESSGGDLYKEISDQTRLCSVRLLEDANGDGIFERSSMFADRINFPMGLAWRNGRLYLADPPDLVTLEDTNDDGRADVRKVIVTGFGHKDNGSLHGLTFGPDGWLYMTCGEPDGYKIKRPDGSFLEGYNGALLRCRPDGADMEVLCRGFVNLVEVIFTPAGEIIGTDNWFRWPGGGVRDALVHLVPGGLYPLHLKDIGTQYPVLSDPLPPVSLFPAVALSGLARYEGCGFPLDMRGNLFAAEHNSRKVTRHVLGREQSTFRAEPHDFLSTDDPDFHPSDVLESPDGSLLVIDTGSWYIHHCPTGRIRKSPATGGIYRIRSTGKPEAAGTNDPRIRAAWDLVDDPSGEAVAKLRRFLRSENGEVIAAAARVAALRRDRTFSGILAGLLTSQNPEVRLACAEALAHCGTSDMLPSLWRAFGDGSDHFLEHALTYAAHHIADARELNAQLQHPNPRVQAAALRLLDQAPRPRDVLSAASVRGLLVSADPAVRQIALGALQKRPEWVTDARAFLGEFVEARDLRDPLRTAFVELALAFKTDPHIQNTIADAMARGAIDVRVAALDVCARSGFSKLPNRWIASLRNGLSDRVIRTHALTAVGSLNIAAFDDILNQIADDSLGSAPVRVQALGILIGRSPRLSESRFEFLRQQLGQDPIGALAASDVLKRAHLDETQLIAALDALPSHSPVVPGSLLGAWRETVSSASNLLNRISRIAGTLPDRDFAALEGKLPTADRPMMKEIRREAERRRSALHAKLDRFAALLEGGNAQLGRAVFFDNRTACATCHAIGNDGGKVGPDLTRIGAIRSGRDILESVLLPSSTFAQTFEPYAITTTDGRELSGTLARQEADSITLRDATGNELRLLRTTVREMRRQQLSIMPEGLEGGISEKEFQDLLAFLQSLK